MIIPDINLLVYAYNKDAPSHARARSWWEGCLNGREAVGLPWVVLLGFIRIMTSRRILVRPMSLQEVVDHVRSWLEQPQTAIVEPGPRHLELVASMGADASINGELTTDLHLAALAVEVRATLCSNDLDFARFPGLAWDHPLR